MDSVFNSFLFSSSHAQESSGHRLPMCSGRRCPALAHVLWPPPSARAFCLPLARALRPCLKMQNRKEGCCRSPLVSFSHCCRSRPDAALRSKLWPWCPTPRHSSKLGYHAGARSAGGGGGARRRYSPDDAGVGKGGRHGSAESEQGQAGTASFVGRFLRRILKWIPV
jgi:hypothetical protein